MEPRDLVNQFRYHPYLSIVFVTLIIGGQAVGIVSNVSIPDKEPDYMVVLVWAYSCDPLKFPKTVYSDEYTRNPIKWWLHCASYHAFGHNIKVLPVIFTVGILPLVYLVAVALTKDKLIGIIALIAFIYNPLYSDWKNSGVYDNVWSFFLLLSVWIMYKSRTAVIPYIASILSKSISILYFPAWIYTHYQVRKNKTELAIICGITVIGVITFSQFVSLGGTPIGFYPERWEDAIFRNISLFWQLIPFAVFIVLSRTFIPTIKVANENVVWAWMLCAFLQNPIVYMFTLQDTYSYRYIPLAAFMSIFVGMTLVNMGNWYAGIQLRKATRL